MKGFKFNGISAGIKKNGERDIGIIYSEKVACAAAVFTKNIVTAAPVVLGQEKIKTGLCQAVIVNSGNANCFTGEKGMEHAIMTSKFAGKALNIPEDFIIVSSTGVIGEPLPIEKIENGILKLTKDFNLNSLDNFAESILTTDLSKKVISRKFQINGKEFSITGIAKGSGMIKPDMATMLAFICTDLDISSSLLNSCLKKSCDSSFNRISVDGDTSTNDTVLILANGMSNAKIKNNDDCVKFQKILDHISYELAKMIVKDGEGATKFVKIIVKGAESNKDAFKVAETISNSNLVKTAIYGEDPNWGRIIAAAGRAGVTINPEKIDLIFDNIFIVKQGIWQGKNAEKKAAINMKNNEIKIILNLNIGKKTDFFMFCDFSENYVKINADYRT